MDLSRVGMFGWSIGGATAAATMRDDARIKASADMYGTFYGPVATSGLRPGPDCATALCARADHRAGQDRPPRRPKMRAPRRNPARIRTRCLTYPDGLIGTRNRHKSTASLNDVVIAFRCARMTTLHPAHGRSRKTPDAAPTRASTAA